MVLHAKYAVDRQLAVKLQLTYSLGCVEHEIVEEEELVRDVAGAALLHQRALSHVST